MKITFLIEVWNRYWAQTDPYALLITLTCVKTGKKEKKNGKVRKNDSSLIIGAYNVYNRRNPFSIYFSQGDGNVSDSFVPGEVTRLSIIGSFVPSITYNFKF